MKEDQERIRGLLTETVTLLCTSGLSFTTSLKVQGLLAITLDDNDVFVVQINETSTENSDSVGTRKSVKDPDRTSSVAQKRGGGKVQEEKHSLIEAAVSQETVSEISQPCLEQSVSSEQVMGYNLPGCIKLDPEPESNCNNVPLSAASVQHISARNRVSAKLLHRKRMSALRNGLMSGKLSHHGRDFARNATYQSDCILLENSVNSLSDRLHHDETVQMNNFRVNEGVMSDMSNGFVARRDTGDNGEGASGQCLQGFSEGEAGEGLYFNVGEDCLMWESSVVQGKVQQRGFNSLTSNARSSHLNFRRAISGFSLRRPWNASGRRPVESMTKQFLCDYPNCNLAYYERKNLLQHQSLKHGRLRRSMKERYCV